MIVLDTNVVSQLVHPQGAPIVLRWLDRQAPSNLCLTAISVMEIRAGLEALADGRKKMQLAGQWQTVLDGVFAGRVLPFDAECAEIAGRLAAQRRRRGVTIDIGDTQVAAIAVARKAAIATRNVRHFPDLPVDVIDPWAS